jgi:hypothetical protein
MTWRSATRLIHSSTVGLLPAKYQTALTSKTLIFWLTSSLTLCYSRPNYPDLRRTQLDQSITFCLAFRNSPVQILEAYQLFHDCLQSCSAPPCKFSDSSNWEGSTETFRTSTIAMTCHKLDACSLERWRSTDIYYKNIELCSIAQLPLLHQGLPLWRLHDLINTQHSR